MECKYCQNKETGEMITCATCKGLCHPSCLELPANIVPVVKTYDWQCNDCKYCYECHNIENEQKILFCDSCDRGYHTYCVKPRLNRKPRGDWFCSICLENNRKDREIIPDEETNKENHSKNNSTDVVEEIKEITDEITITQEILPKNIPEKVKITAEKDFKKINADKIVKGSTEKLKKAAEKITSAAEESNKEGNLAEDITVTEDRSFAGSKIFSSTKKKCKYAKKFSDVNMCPFHGCDGKGNTRGSHNFHVSLNHCPLSKESRKREKILNSSNSTSPSPPKKKVELSGEIENSKDVEVNKNAIPQTPIENIVSKTDIEMFEAAKKKAQAVLAQAVLVLDQEMAPTPGGLKSIIFGDVEIDVWYKSQYALEFSRLPKLYICEFCLQYMKTETIYERHMAKCTIRNPPGDEIYRKDKLSVFEVNGATSTVYCQNLCLMAKLFLDHKTLWLDVAPFLFYIMTISDERGCHIVGYFSKEKVSFLNYNVSCILVLPHHMKKGYGRLLIDFSYLLTATEGKTGSPERPLSDMGLMSYRKFWREKLLKYLISYTDDQISVKAISETMAIHANDVISTLQYLGMLKYWKGKHLILLKKEVIQEYALEVKVRSNDYKEIDASCLTWTPTNYK